MLIHLPLSLLFHTISSYHAPLIRFAIGFGSNQRRWCSGVEKKLERETRVKLAAERMVGIEMIPFGLIVGFGDLGESKRRRGRKGFMEMGEECGSGSGSAPEELLQS